MVLKATIWGFVIGSVDSRARLRIKVYIKNSCKYVKHMKPEISKIRTPKRVCNGLVTVNIYYKYH